MKYETIEVDGVPIFVRRSRATVRLSGGRKQVVERVRLVGPTVGPDGLDGPLVSPETRDAFFVLAHRESGSLCCHNDPPSRSWHVNVKDDPTNGGRTSWERGLYEHRIDGEWPSRFWYKSRHGLTADEIEDLRLLGVSVAEDLCEQAAAWARVHAVDYKSPLARGYLRDLVRDYKRGVSPEAKDGAS